MYIKVKVFPKSRKEEIIYRGDLKIPLNERNRFEIKVKEKAERNMANKKVLEILAKYFKIEEKDLKIISGHQHPSKLLSINDDVLEVKKIIK
ncbi:MAG: DUF167 domain-containing protein [Patescibacteria group bacterium]